MKSVSFKSVNVNSLNCVLLIVILVLVVVCCMNKSKEGFKNRRTCKKIVKGKETQAEAREACYTNGKRRMDGNCCDSKGCYDICDDVFNVDAGKTECADLGKQTCRKNKECKWRRTANWKKWGCIRKEDEGYRKESISSQCSSTKFKLVQPHCWFGGHDGGFFGHG